MIPDGTVARGRGDRIDPDGCCRCAGDLSEPAHLAEGVRLHDLDLII